MGCLSNVNPVPEENINGNADHAVLITRYLHYEQRKCCDRNFAPTLTLTLNGGKITTVQDMR